MRVWSPLSSPRAAATNAANFNFNTTLTLTFQPNVFGSRYAGFMLIHYLNEQTRRAHMPYWHSQPVYFNYCNLCRLWIKNYPLHCFPDIHHNHDPVAFHLFTNGTTHSNALFNIFSSENMFTPCLFVMYMVRIRIRNLLELCSRLINNPQLW